MRDTLTPTDSTTLVRLWRHRHALSPDEMGRMYGIVGTALQGCNPPELAALGEGRQELVAQFIYAKVLRLDDDARMPDAARPDDDDEAEEEDDHSAPSTAYALCAYFRRYLIDCTRASAFRRKVAIGDQITEDQLEVHMGRQAGAPDGGAAACLAEHGLDAACVQASARAFIAALGEPERLLLCEGFGREAPGGLSGVAARHAIASYHYRAGRLGLVHKREALPVDYARTQLGGWLQSLGIAIAADNMGAIRAVFEILGAEASYA